MFTHCDSSFAPFEKLYYNKPGSLVDISKMDTRNFKYVYSGHFLAKKDMLLEICEKINLLLYKDMDNQDFFNWYPPITNERNAKVNGRTAVYDETYFNYYLNETLLKEKRNVKVMDGKTYAKAYYVNFPKSRIQLLNKNQMNCTGMRISADELMRHSFVITIDDKRWEQFNRLFAAHGLILPQKFQGTCDPRNKPQRNCYLSHRNAILKAKELNWPYVCVFEDDAYPIMGIKEYLDNSLANVPDLCSVLILGHSGCINERAYNAQFVNNVTCFGSHAYIVFRNAYDKYLRFLDNYKFADSWQFTNERILPKKHFFGTKKNIFIQFCEKKSMNGHCGYIWRINKKDATDQQIFSYGYKPIEQIIPHGKTTNWDGKVSLKKPPTPTNVYIRNMFQYG